ncbi:ATP-binding protein [Methylobacterium sp. D53M]
MACPPTRRPISTGSSRKASPTPSATRPRTVAIALNVAETDGGAEVQLILTDDGSGAPVEALERPHSGLGLLGMRDRVHALGGQIVMETSPGGGFRLRVRFHAALAGEEVS